MIYLPDVNVWIALTFDRHVHHKPAVEWISVTTEPIAFCRITQMGLLRLLTNRAVMAGDVVSVQSAWEIVARIQSDDRISFAEEPPGLEQTWQSVTRGQKSGSNFWTDAYLSAFAQTGGFTLVTFDKAFRAHQSLPVRVLA